MYEIILEHSAKGTTWKDHKYIKKEDGRYIYDTKVEGSKRDEHQIKKEEYANNKLENVKILSAMYSTNMKESYEEEEEAKKRRKLASEALRQGRSGVAGIHYSRANELEKSSKEKRSLAESAFGSLESQLDEYNDTAKYVQDLKSKQSKKMNQYKRITSSARKESELEQKGREAIRTVLKQLEKLANK